MIRDSLQRAGRQIGVASIFLLGTGTPVLTTAILPQPAYSQAVPASVQRGYTQLSQGLVDQAIATFKQALQQFPNSLEAKLGLAIAYARAGRDEAAWSAYQQVLAQDSRNRLALQAVGKLGGFRPEWQAQGIAALTTLLDIDPDDREARSQRALLYSYQGRFAESLGDYQIILQAGRPTADVLLGAAQAYTYSGNSAKGLELFEQYRAVTGKDIGKNAAIAYARALRESGNVSQSIGVLEGILSPRLDEFAVQVRGELAQSYLANNQAALALGVLDPLRERDDARLPLARALNEIGKQERRLELRSEAAQLYLQALQTADPSDISLKREIADVLGGIPGQQPIALNLYRQLVQENPNDRILAIRRLVLENRVGAMSSAQVMQQLRPLLQPFPTDAAQQQALAQALIPLEPNLELFPVYQALLQAGVNEPFLNFRLAQLYIQQGDFDSAQAAIAVYKNTPAGAQDFAPDVLLADIARRQGNAEAAAQSYLRLLAIPNLEADIAYSALQGLAGVRVVQGRAIEALALYDQLLQRNPGDWQLRLGRTAIAYQAKLISDVQADQVLMQFLQFNPGETPQEFYTLTALLPPTPQREPLYRALLQADPNNLDIQVRLIQVLSQRNPLEAQRSRISCCSKPSRWSTLIPIAACKAYFYVVDWPPPWAI